jgi:pRiA4b ORF-3-like protein
VGQRERSLPDAFELDGRRGHSRGRVAVADLNLRKGKTIAYLFDFGDEWRVLLKVVDRWEAGDETYPQIVEASGTPPPQYTPLDDGEDGED